MRFNWFKIFGSLVITASFFKEEQPKNREPVLAKSLAFLRLKFDKFKLSKEVHSMNIQFKSLTFSVLKLDKSKLFKEEQPLNIVLIYITFLVLKFEKSKLIIDEQSQNKD